MLIVRWKSCMEEIERNDVATKSDSSSTTAIHARPRKELHEGFQGCCRWLIGRMTCTEDMTMPDIVSALREVARHVCHPPPPMLEGHSKSAVVFECHPQLWE